MIKEIPTTYAVTGRLLYSIHRHLTINKVIILIPIYRECDGLFKHYTGDIMISSLEVRFQEDGKTAVLSREMFAVTSKGLITVPLGFNTDFCSVPAIVAFIPKLGRYTKASVVHDWLYYSDLFTQKECDGIYKELMLAEGCKSWRVSMIYRALRMAGSFAFNSHRKANHSSGDFA